ncbi:hypothetical protein [Bacillus infantis]|nr:hypothetical protein [Bacillus infantis]
MKKEEQFGQVLEFALQKAEQEQKLTVGELMEEIKEQLMFLLKEK